MTAAVLRAGSLTPRWWWARCGTGWGPTPSWDGARCSWPSPTSPTAPLRCSPPGDHHHHQPGQRAPGLLPRPGPRPGDVRRRIWSGCPLGQGHRLRRRPEFGPVLAHCPRELITYSLEPGRADFYATDLHAPGAGYRFRLWRRGEALGHRHPAPGGVPLRLERHGRLRGGAASWASRSRPGARACHTWARFTAAARSRAKPGASW